MKEIVVISGKGGTGKTSLAASLCALASPRAAIADCDVDAADIHLVLAPEILHSHEFKSGYKAAIRPADCIACDTCKKLCRFGAILRREQHGTSRAEYAVDTVACEGCGVCVRFCPSTAIDFEEEVCGRWFVSSTRFGPMVHARLGVGAENSGKLVTLVRNEAKAVARERGLEFVIIDGSPGIGCPVIASLTSADLALIVTEPTISGHHDLQRIARLTGQLKVPAMVCVNKCDVNADTAKAIRDFAVSKELRFGGDIPYDPVATEAQRARKAIVEYGSGKMSDAIRTVWENVLMAV